MNIREGAPVSDLTIQSMKFRVPQPFTAGHVLNENEAAVLNQTFLENIRNNFANTVDKAKEEADKAGGEVDQDELQTKLDAYVGEYEFGVRRAGGARLDPVDREARNMAWEQIKPKLAEKKVKISEVSAEQKNRLIDQMLEKYPAIRERAAQMVEARKSATADLEIDFDAAA